MVKEIEGKFNVGDTSLYTKTWLVSNTFLALVIHQTTRPPAHPSAPRPLSPSLPLASPAAVSHTSTIIITPSHPHTHAHLHPHTHTHKHAYARTR